MKVPPRDSEGVEQAESRSKDFQVSRLLAALGGEGCPICRDASGSDPRYFFWFFHENYNSVETLDGLTRSLGFCPSHGAQALLNREGQSALAAVHEVLARRIGAILSRHASAPLRGEGRGPLPAPADPCPACRNREEAVERSASFLAAALQDSSGIDRYGHPGLLCFPHLRTVAPHLPEPVLGRILNVQESAVASAMESLSKLRSGASVVSSVDPNDLKDALMPALRLVADGEGHPEFGSGTRIPETSRNARDPVGDFLEMLRDGGDCPVCMEVRRARTEWMAWLENAAWHGREMQDVLPTCPEHVRAAVQAADPSLVFATLRRALEAASVPLRRSLLALSPPPVPESGSLLHRILETFQQRSPRLREARRFLAGTPPCPLCNRLAEARDRILALLFALLEAPHHRSAFERGYGLCLGHFSRAMALRPPPAARAILMEVEAARFALLQWELEESLRKDAWTNRPETPGAEHIAWRRAVRRFSGSVNDADG
jgi:hypothetical protein